tara:strand:+ start:4551 stop:4820 length:270 start_codon:yes stop_codon:yes gene_type:complete
MTIGKSFAELERAAREIAEERGVAREGLNIIQCIKREADKLEILEASRQEYKRSGHRLPKDLKRRLSERYFFSEKDIERLVYSNTKDIE